MTTRKGGAFAFFTPRATLKWMPTDSHMLYGLVAKGVKTGGFNAVDLDQHPEQAHYDEERSHTFELGVKNRLFNNTLTLNAALYRIDWQDIQGSEAANGDRTLANASIQLALGHWRGTLWARNIADAEYVGNSFVVPSFTRYIVGLGARRALGLTLRYVL